MCCVLALHLTEVRDQAFRHIVRTNEGVRHQRLNGTVHGALQDRPDAQPLIRLDRGDQGEDMRFHTADMDRMRAALIHSAGDLHHIIIGKAGQTLRAISTVLKAACNNTFKKRINLTVDVNHYKEDRYRKVRGMANRIAKEVVRSHIDVALDPMPNDERKVVHQFLSNREHIKTESEGEGNKRHLIIKYVD